LTETRHSGVGEGHAEAESGAAETFPRAELVEDKTLRQRLARCRQEFAQRFERTLAARHSRRSYHHAFGREQIEYVYRHGESGIMPPVLQAPGWLRSAAVRTLSAKSLVPFLIAMMVTQLLFVALDLAIQLVDEGVDGGMHPGSGRIGV
jgi:hypothetical protein